MAREATLKLLRWSCVCVGLAAILGRHFLADKAGEALDILSSFYGGDEESDTEEAATDDRDDYSELLGSRGALIFGSLDLDSNGRISAKEFAPIVEALTGEGPPLSRQGAATAAGDAFVLSAAITPLDFTSMKIVQDEGMQGLMRNVKNLRGLTSWRQPSQSQQEFVASELRPFTPLLKTPVGKAYYVYKPEVEVYWKGTNTRYYPPVPKGNEVIIYKLLRMFHARPFILTRFGPYGTVAVIEAENDRFFKISFRIHAEFQLNEPPLYPFWYSPAQFSGSFIIAKDYSRVVQFHMSVPSDRLLNVDMEWVTEIDPDTKSERMEVEIGHMAQMELTWNSSSSEDLGTWRWEQQISKEQAAASLERLLYPFKKIEYLPLLDAFNKAEEERKLVHSILLWGSLDDQSC